MAFYGVTEEQMGEITDLQKRLSAAQRGMMRTLKFFEKRRTASGVDSWDWKRVEGELQNALARSFSPDDPRRKKYAPVKTTWWMKGGK